MIAFFVTGYLVNLLSALTISLILRLSLLEKKDEMATYVLFLHAPIRNHLLFCFPFFTGIRCILFLINYFTVKDSTYNLIKESSFTFF